MPHRLHLWEAVQLCIKKSQLCFPEGCNLEKCNFETMGDPRRNTLTTVAGIETIRGALGNAMIIVRNHAKSGDPDSKTIG